MHGQICQTTASDMTIARAFPEAIFVMISNVATQNLSDNFDNLTFSFALLILTK